MPRLEIHHLHPTGWENDAEEERIPFSTLDYLPACVFNNYVLFFRLDDADKARMAALLKEGLERTLGQTRHLCGTIEKDAGGGHSFVKRRDSTVQFHVQWLDEEEPAAPGVDGQEGQGQGYPSFDELESHHFSSTLLGDLGRWSVAPMTHGVKPEAHIDNSPPVAAFKANFIRGGLVFNIHVHHCSNDIMGWASFVHQLAENCRAILGVAAFPAWDPGCLDRSRLYREDKVSLSEEGPNATPAGGAAGPEAAASKPAAPPPAGPRADLLPVSSLLFHLPKSKAARLKALATPELADGSSPSSSWVTTFDAFSAFIWQTLLRLRAPLLETDPSSSIVWMAPVDMRRRLHSPPCPPRTQGNLFCIVRSEPVASAESVTERPLSEVASMIRALVAEATQEDLDRRLDAAAATRDKKSLFLRTDKLSPLSLLVTDWRATEVTAADFGLATPRAFRHVSDNVTRCVAQVYPPRSGAGPDEGFEFAIVYEKEFAKGLIEDPEWSSFFEYRGLV